MKQTPDVCCKCGIIIKHGEKIMKKPDFKEILQILYDEIDLNVNNNTIQGYKECAKKISERIGNHEETREKKM